MKLVGLPAVLSLGALSALVALASSPAQAQYVSIPVTNGNFAITNNGGTLQYSTMPTFLSPAGTLTINTADPNFAAFHSLTPITTNTPVGFTDNGSLAGSVSLNDGRTGTFTGAGASLRGIATVTGAPSVTLPSTRVFYRLSLPFFYSTLLPNGATLTYTAQSGAIHIPAASLGTYSTTQFTIPISGGSFTLIDPTGTGNATVTLNSVLTPLGTTTLTLNAPNLSSSSPVIRFASYFITPTLTANLGGLANGTVALSDGRTATVTNRLIALRANTQVTHS